MERYFYDEQGRLNMRFLATPYGGVIDGQDFKGTHFSERTDFGPLEKALSYLDHNNLAIHHPELKNLPGITDRLGVAVREGLSKEEGLVYRIVVDEAYRYKNMLKALADAGALDYASTTPYQKGYQVDKSTGEILRYEIIEVGPTWKPAHPGATHRSAADVEEIAKSIIMKELEMAEEVKTDVQETSEAAAVVDAAVSETPVTDAVAAIFQAEEGSTEKSVPDVLGEVLSQLSALNEKFEAYEARQATTEKSIKDFTLAIPKGFELLANNLKSKATDDKQRSNIEKSIVEQFQQKSNQTSAPGRELKSTNLGVRN